MTNSPSEERLNKFLAFQLGVSRREADNLISEGKVTINDKTAIIGRRVSESDNIKVNGIPVSKRASYTYMLFNKPVGYVCSRKQQGDSPTIYDLIPRNLHNLKTVGRLDRDSSGLILLTDDGDFTHNMTHPSFIKTKVYNIEIDLPLQPLHQQMISDFGVMLDDGRSQLGLTKLSEDRKKWEITMHEGRNRQIRRTFASLGYQTLKLHRLSFGNYVLGELKEGQLKEISHL